MKNMKVRSRNLMFLTGKRTQVLWVVLVWACVLLATPALASKPTIQFSPRGGGAGRWEYDGAGTFSFVQDITVDEGVGSGTDALVGALVYIPDLSVGGIPVGPYTLIPNGPGTIMIKSPDNTQIYLTGTLGSGDLVPIGTTALSYTNFQVDITNVTVTDDGRALGSDTLDAIDSARCPLDFNLVLSGATQGFKNILDNGTMGSNGFTASMTIKCPDCQLEVTKKACVITPGSNQCYKGNKVKSMILEYTGQGCGASSHSQDPTKVKCSGDPSFAEPVNILATDKKHTKNWGLASAVPIGGHVVVDAADEGKDNLDSETLVIITNATGDVVLQEVAFHTSCSQPLSVGDQFGSMRLISLTTTEGGTVSSDTCITEIPATGAEVEYTYTITNTGTTTVTGVTVIDDVFGAVPGSPIASILPGNSHTLTMTVPMTEAATNTVVVTAAEGCTANATATITKAPPEPTECTTKVQAMLLEYIGPEITDATVEFLPNNKKFKNKPVVYANINLIPGTVLSLATENNWTIDSLAHDTGDLGSKVSILINNVAEVIHTSCSTPFVSDKPAPLDNPKGVPSPNWFVVDFRQK